MLRLEEEDIYAGIATSGSGGGDTPESAKGSFNASTQQLTLKYDYLVEKINSSDQLTAETKELIIGRLNNSDVVVDMTRDTFSTTGHSSDIAWVCSDGDPTSENPDEFPTTMIFVSKSNPETSKLVIPDGAGLVFGSYNAMRAMYELQGQSLTAEEVEALLSSSVVDEEVFTISGTLGNFEVEFIEDGPVVEKYGATISNFLGDVDSNGVLQAPSGEWSLNFSGVKVLRTDSLPSYFLYKDNGIKTISLPDLETIYASDSNSGFQQFAQYSSIERFNCPKLKNFQRASGVTGCNVFNGAFAYCPNFKGINSDNGILFPEIEDMTDASMGITFSTQYITFISFPKLKKISGWDYGILRMAGPNSSSDNKVTSISFPLLEELSGKSNIDYRECSLGLARMGSLETITFLSLTKVYENRAIDLSYCTALTSVSFPALKSNSFGTNYGVTKPFHNMLQGVTGCTVHFPSNMQSVMENMGSVTAGFGGTNTTVLFDLPATE